MLIVIILILIYNIICRVISIYESGGRVMGELGEIYVRIGNNMAALRNEKKLTQEQVAEEMPGTSQSLISQYESGKKKMSLEKIFDFCQYYDVSLKELMFGGFGNKTTDAKRDKNESETDPINKCTGKTYFCYYIKEQNGTNGEFKHKIKYFKLKIVEKISSHKAGGIVSFPGKDGGAGEIHMKAEIRMDESYAYVKCEESSRDFCLELTFFYYRQVLSRKYVGGMGILRTLDYHNLPICQFCIISANAVASDKFQRMESLLCFSVQEDKRTNLSERIVSSSSILRLTKKLDARVYDWLCKNVRLKG